MKRMNVSVGLILLALSTAARASDAVPSWAAPSSWTPPSAGATGRSALVTYPPLPFIPLTPCRVINTRSSIPVPFPDLWGPPSLSGSGFERTFPIAGQCGIPLDAQAVSFNLTVVGPVSVGDLRVFPAGGVTPSISTLNWPANIVALANAAVVALGFTSILGSNGITVHVDGAGSLDLVVDVNGFYGSTPANANNYFTLNTNSTGFTMRLTNTSETCAGPCGLYQTVESGIAVEGDSNSANLADAGVRGSGTAAIGVQGLSVSNVAVLGVTGSTASDLAGVLGKDGSGESATGGFFSAGVRGEGREGVVGITATAGGWGVAGAAFSPATVAVETLGNFAATGTKAFVEPHPIDPMMTIRYVALEGPEAGTYFRGTAKTVGREAVIPVPESFRMVTDEEGLTVQVTPVGELAQVAVMSQDLNQIVVRSSREVTFHYHVNGVRRAFKNWQVVTEGREFRPISPDQKMPGWLTEEAKSRLIANGTYNPDGTVNMSTAERMGWAKVWREEAAAAPPKAR